MRRHPGVESLHLYLNMNIIMYMYVVKLSINVYRNQSSSQISLLCLHVSISQQLCNVLILFQRWTRRRQPLRRSILSIHLRWVTRGEEHILSQLRMRKTKKLGLKHLKFAAEKLQVSQLVYMNFLSLYSKQSVNFSDLVLVDNIISYNQLFLKRFDLLFNRLVNCLDVHIYHLGKRVGFLWKS